MSTVGMICEQREVSFYRSLDDKLGTQLPKHIKLMAKCKALL